MYFCALKDYNYFFIHVLHVSLIKFLSAEKVLLNFLAFNLLKHFYLHGSGVDVLKVQCNKLDALRAFTRASLRVRVLNAMKTNKRIRIF